MENFVDDSTIAVCYYNTVIEISTREKNKCPFWTTLVYRRAVDRRWEKILAYVPTFGQTYAPFKKNFHGPLDVCFDRQSGCVSIQHSQCRWRPNDSCFVHMQLPLRTWNDSLLSTYLHFWRELAGRCKYEKKYDTFLLLNNISSPVLIFSK